MRKTIGLISLALLAACGGGTGGTANPPGGGNALPPPPAIAPVDTSVILSAQEAVVNGDQSWYTSGTATWSNHAGGTAGAPNGSAAVDGAACDSVRDGSTYPSTAYTQHLFVGIYDNGSEMALPQAIGMPGAQPPTTAAPPDWPSGHPNDNYAVELAKCQYNVHVHDYSGLVHVQDPSLSQSNGVMPAYATLQTLFDLWGARITSNGITAGANALTGRTIVYAGTPSGLHDGNDLVSSYSLYSGSLGTLQFARHMAVWIVIGALPAQGLPEVQIVQEY